MENGTLTVNPTAKPCPGSPDLLSLQRPTHGLVRGSAGLRPG